MTVLVTQDCLGYSGSFVFPWNTKLIFSACEQSVTGVLNPIAMSLWMAFGVLVILTTGNLLTRGHGRTFHLLTPLFLLQSSVIFIMEIFTALD